METDPIPVGDNPCLIRLATPGDADTLRRNRLSGWPLDELRGEQAGNDPLPAPEAAAVVFRPRGDGALRADLEHRGRSLSHLVIERRLVRYGVATLQIDYLDSVWTEEDCRGRGYARRLIGAALDRMRRGGGVFSLLYGIGDFYHRFGYATLGADYGVTLRNATRLPAPLPDGWTVRPLRAEDLPAVRRLYDAATPQATMARVRHPDASIWSQLAALARGEREDACRVVVDGQGNVGGYLWEGRGFWMVEHSREQWFPDDLTLGEVVAGSPAGADAALAAARQWAGEEVRRRGRPIQTVHCGAGPGSRIASAAQYQDAAVNQTSWRSAGPQVRALDTLRLLQSIAPELARHVAGPAAGAVPAAFGGPVLVQTETGSATLCLRPDGLDVRPADPTGGTGAEVRLCQKTLIRLVLGALPAADLLERAEPHLGAAARAWLEALFLQRRPYMYPLDR